MPRNTAPTGSKARQVRLPLYLSGCSLSGDGMPRGVEKRRCLAHRRWRFSEPARADGSPAGRVRGDRAHSRRIRRWLPEGFAMAFDSLIPAREAALAEDLERLERRGALRDRRAPAPFRIR